MKLTEELKERGFVYHITNEEIFESFNEGGRSLYFGVDPSSNSMQLGNFIALMNAFHFMKNGNKLYLLVGGATGMIGNPTGKENERDFLSEEEVRKNQEGIRQQFEDIAKRVEEYLGTKVDYEIVNNYDFVKDMNIVQFLREVGKYITVNWMMSKDFVKNRVEDPDKSISHAEFSYMLLMGYDFYKLYKDKGVTLQVGGSDEWDGILTGIELVNKKLGENVAGFTNPLVTDITGKKFGKSEGNAVRLDKQKNSPYFVYQYLLNTADEDVDKLLRLITFLDIDKIEDILKKHFEKPEERYGQQILAEEVCNIIFGKEETETAKKITRIFFSKEDKIDLIKGLNSEEITSLMREAGGASILNDINIIDALVESGIAGSKGQAKRELSGGGIYFNEEKVEDEDFVIGKSNLINGNIGLLRKGKKTYKIIKLN